MKEIVLGKFVNRDKDFLKKKENKKLMKSSIIY